jgi:hypothetical protein
MWSSWHFLGYVVVQYQVIEVQEVKSAQETIKIIEIELLLQDLDVLDVDYLDPFV